MFALAGVVVLLLDTVGAVEKTETITSWQSLGLCLIGLQLVFPVPIPVTWPWQRRG